MNHSLTSTYIPNFIEIEETLWTDGRTDGHLRPTLLGRLGGVDLKMTKLDDHILVHLEISKNCQTNLLIKMQEQYTGVYL